MKVPDPAERPTLTIPEAGAFLGLGRSASYEAVRRGEIPVLRFGRRIVVATAALRKLLEIGRASEGTALDIKRGITGDDQRLDYDGSNNLIYAGKAPAGALTSDGTWVIQKMTWTGANLTYIQQKTGSWDNRASLGW